MTRARPTRLSRRACLGGAAAASLGVPAAARLTFKSEIVVRTVANLRNQEDVSALVALAAQHGVSTINIAAKQDEDDEIASGFVFYDSRIAPRTPGFETFDALRVTVREAHRHGIRVRAWVPQFHDQMATRAHPEWQMQSLRGGLVVPYAGRDRKEFFLNPMNLAARDYQRSIVEEVARAYDVDGIVIDWVRFDGYAMDLGDETRAKFKDVAGLDPIEIDFSRDNPRRRQWNAWREAQIADHVRRLRATLDDIKPGLELGAYILPPEFIEVAQDAAQFSDSMTFLSPMAYYGDWSLPASWIVQTLLPQTAQKAAAAAIIPVFDEDLSDAAARAALPEIRRRWPGIGTLSWFVYGKWTRTAFQRIDRLLQS
jgi:uncharacterized lipoprotein YddW (UPF0748 family)